MERNWLIRTSQNQILGPVAKQKLLEFIQKGALGLTDEVTSGNGYWFQLREKDLVEKYLYGDLPQGYNPISESKSVLAIRENPETTSSINFSPANKTQPAKIDPINLVIPKAEDLEFPDISSIEINQEVSSVKLSTVLKVKHDEVKLPANDDLEFPDIEIIQNSVSTSSSQPLNTSVEATQFISIAIPKVQPTKMEMKASSSPSVDIEAHYPKEDDLEFPDVNITNLESTMMTSPKIEKGKVDLSHQYTRTVALDNQQKQTELPKVLGEIAQADTADEEWEFDVQVTQKTTSLLNGSDKEERTNDEFFAKKDIKRKFISQADIEFADSAEVEPLKPKKNEKIPVSKEIPEEKKLLFERKVKSSKSPATMRDPDREIQAKKTQNIGEPLKKRNDNYLFFILIIIFLIIVAVFFYFKEILNKPLPV